MPETVKGHVRRARELQGSRSSWDNHWEDCARLFLPRRTGFTTTSVEGDRRTEDLFDGTPMRAARGLANALGGIIRPDGNKWFHIKPVTDELEDEGAAKEWIEQAENVIRDAFEDPRSRFRQATGETDLDLVTFGTGVMAVLPARDLSGLLLQSLHLKDALVLFTDEGNPKGLYRFRKMKLHQIVARWGVDKLSPGSQEKWRNDKYDEDVELLQVVVENKDGRPDSMLSKNLPFSIMWIEAKEEHVLETSGDYEFPFVVPRWDTSSGETYGRSPAMIALPDALTLQAMGETILVAGQRRADPPLAAPADAAFNEINTFPGGLSYYDPATAQGRNPFFEIGNGGDIGLTREMQADYRDQVFASFFRNVLNLPIEGPQMTATEVMQRKEEFIREIGPVFGRLETEYTGPLVERAFRILMRQGAFPELPESLSGQKIRFEYQSPVKQMRQQIEARAAQMWVAELTSFAGATGDLSVLDVVKLDEYGRFTAEAGGIPADLIASREEVAQKQEARAKAMQQQEQVDQVRDTAEIGKTAAEAAKAVDLDIGSLVGGLGGAEEVA